MFTFSFGRHDKNDLSSCPIHLEWINHFNLSSLKQTRDIISSFNNDVNLILIIKSWPGVFFSLVSMSPDTCTGESCSNRPFPPLYPLQFTLRFTVDSTILSKLESTFVIYSQSLNYIFQVSELDYLQNLKIFVNCFLN